MYSSFIITLILITILTIIIGIWVLNRIALLGSCIIAAGCVCPAWFVCDYFETNNNQHFEPEYELEILNQDSVAVKSMSTGKAFIDGHEYILYRMSCVHSESCPNPSHKSEKR